MSAVGSAVSRSWGECAWTARDLLRRPAPVRITVLPRRPEPEVRLVVVPFLANGWLLA